MLLLINHYDINEFIRLIEGIVAINSCVKENLERYVDYLKDEGRSDEMKKLAQLIDRIGRTDDSTYVVSTALDKRGQIVDAKTRDSSEYIDLAVERAGSWLSQVAKDRIEMYAIENYARHIGFSKELRTQDKSATADLKSLYLNMVRLEAESVLRDMTVPEGDVVDILEYRDRRIELEHRGDSPDSVIVKARFNSLIDCYNGYRADSAMWRAKQYIDESEWGKASAALDTAMNYSNGFAMPSSKPKRVLIGDDFVESLGSTEIVIRGDMSGMVSRIEALSTTRHSATMRAALLRAIELLMSKVYTGGDSAMRSVLKPPTAGAQVLAPEPAQTPEIVTSQPRATETSPTAEDQPTTHQDSFNEDEWDVK